MCDGANEEERKQAKNVKCDKGVKKQEKKGARKAKETELGERHKGIESWVERHRSDAGWERDEGQKRKSFGPRGSKPLRSAGAYDIKVQEKKRRSGRPGRENRVASCVLGPQTTKRASSKGRNAFARVEFGGLWPSARRERCTGSQFGRHGTRAERGLFGSSSALAKAPRTLRRAPQLGDESKEKENRGRRRNA